MIIKIKIFLFHFIKQKLVFHVGKFLSLFFLFHRTPSNITSILLRYLFMLENFFLFRRFTYSNFLPTYYFYDCKSLSEGLNAEINSTRAYWSLKSPGYYNLMIRDQSNILLLLENFISQFESQTTFKADYFKSRGRYPFLLSWRIWKTVSKESHYSIADDQHFDNYPLSQIKVFVPLQAISESEGPFHYVLTIFSGTALRLGFSRQFDHQINLKKYSLEIICEKNNIPFKYEKFTCKDMSKILALDTGLIIHKAGVPDEGKSRIMLQLVYGVSNLELELGSLKDFDPFDVF
jgi:hypothetical protein